MTPPRHLDRAGGDDALGCAADAEHQVDAGAVARGHDGAGDVTVRDELDARTGGAYLLDHCRMPGPVEDHDGHVVG